MLAQVDESAESQQAGEISLPEEGAGAGQSQLARTAVVESVLSVQNQAAQADFRQECCTGFMRLPG